MIDEAADLAIAQLRRIEGYQEKADDIEEARVYARQCARMLKEVSGMNPRSHAQNSAQRAISAYVKGYMLGQGVTEEAQLLIDTWTRQAAKNKHRTTRNSKTDEERREGNRLQF